MRWAERGPTDRVVVDVDGYDVVTYSFGTGDDVLLCLNGGPGLPCDYLREAHSALADEGFRVVAFDQLGTGASSRPTDESLWTIERYVDEVEAVRTTLQLGKVHLLGHSWGGWLGIEYALKHHDALRSLILESTVADIPHLTTELERLRAALGPETVTMMQRHEAEGTFTHPEYQAAVTLLNYRHVCRMQEWPAPVTRSLNDWNAGPYNAIQGPNEFLYTGNLKDWNRIPDLSHITVPVLITCGEHDELTAACSMRMRDALPESELHVVPHASHMAFYENPDVYYPILLDFLRRLRRATTHP